MMSVIESITPAQLISLKDELTTNLLMQDLNERLNTFGNWTGFIDKHSLAEDGFYYTGIGDKVRCAFCLVEIFHWEAGDIPNFEHKRFSPNCIALKGSSPNNVQGRNIFQLISEDECGFGMENRCHNQESANLTALLNNLGIETNITVAHPNYVLLNKRLSSFEHWPVSIKQKPNELVAAGFYYTGFGDETVCFHCGLGLRAWQEEDDPWEQHARWSEKCAFLRLKKGTEFINEVKQKYSMVNITSESIAPSASSLDVEEACAKYDIKIHKNNSTSQQDTSSQNSEKAKERTERRDTRENVLLCGICYENERSIMNLPCHHVIACVDCSVTFKTCPVCRQEVHSVTKVLLS